MSPRFFELTVSMAFEYFAKEKVDIAIIETGLGGRLDSTNIIQPELSIITNIGFDHMNLLGDTLESISFEKAGIIKTNIPVVIGTSTTQTKPVFEKRANNCGVIPTYAEDIYAIIEVHKEINRISCTLKHNKTGNIEKISSDLNGEYQAENIRTVMTALDQLKNGKFRLEKDKSIRALSHVKKLTGLMGRWDILSQKPLVIADVAHNEDGIRKVLHQLKTGYGGKNLHIVIGFVADKDIQKILQLLPENASYYFTQAHIPRALQAIELQQQANQYGLYGAVYENVDEALQSAIASVHLNDIILICGSFFLLAELSFYKEASKI